MKYVVTAYQVYEKFDDLDAAKLFFDCLVHGGKKYVELKERTVTDEFEYFKSLKIFVK